MYKNIGKDISKSFTVEYSPNLLDHAKQSATAALTSWSC